MQLSKILLGVAIVASSAFAAPNVGTETPALAKRQEGTTCPPGLLWDPVNNECRNVSTSTSGFHRGAATQCFLHSLDARFLNLQVSVELTLYRFMLVLQYPALP
jgi:hypothetical protein